MTEWECDFVIYVYRIYDHLSGYYEVMMCSQTKLSMSIDSINKLFLYLCFFIHWYHLFIEPFVHTHMSVIVWCSLRGHPPS